MAKTPDQRARTETSQLLEVAGCLVQDYTQTQIHTARSETIPRYSPNHGFGEADSLFYGNARAAGVMEVKKHGTVLNSVDVQSGKYPDGLSTSLSA